MNPTPRALVPVTPTKEMVKAAVDADDKRTGAETCKHIYRAMLQAAPHSGAVSEEEVERAAKAMCEFEHMGDKEPWKEMEGDETREYWRKHARTAFRAIGLTVEG